MWDKNLSYLILLLKKISNSAVPTLLTNKSEPPLESLMPLNLLRRDPKVLIFTSVLLEAKYRVDRSSVLLLLAHLLKILRSSFSMKLLQLLIKRMKLKCKLQ